MPAVGVSIPRRDSGSKVRGATRYAADASIPGLLHARLVLSHEAHAMIRSIGTEAALEIPGVVAVLTAGDLPIKGSGKGRLFEPLAREEVVYAGQPVALVIAESEALAEDGVELVEVELEPLEPVLDLEAATQPDAPLARVNVRDVEGGSDLGDAHASVAAGGIGDDEDLSDNVLDTARLANGDVDAALAASHVRVQGRLTTPWMYQGYIEPQSAIAWLEPEGELVDPQLDPGSVRHAGLAGQAVRTSGRANPDPQRAAGRRVRRQDDDHRARWWPRRCWRCAARLRWR